jgi:hypothetical protein
MHRPFARAALVAWLLCACAASVALGRPGVLVTRQGQTLTGDITEREQTYVVNIRGIDTIIQRGDVQSIEYIADLEKQFRDRLAKLGPKDAKGRIDLARWAFDHDHYDLSREALEAARAIEPNNPDATRMLETVQSQIRLERARQARPATGETPRNPPTTGPTHATAGAATGPATTARHLLTAEDINSIKQLEINPKVDAQLKFTFMNDVRKRFVQQENLNPASFAQLRPQEQALRILEYGTPEMKRDVRVMSHPASMLDFHRLVQPLVLQNCATSNCHGGNAGGAGGLFLFSPADNDSVSYTNFYILQAYQRPGAEKPGVFGAGEERMIDRPMPRKSLLINYAMPPTMAEFDHPDVRGYRPALRNRDDPNYTRVLDWIEFALVPTRDASDYGIVYEPPGRPRSATRAATQPAGAAPPTTQPDAPAPATQPAQPPQPAR